MSGFDDVSSRYDSLWTLQEGYTNWMVSNICQFLDVSVDDEIVDLGSGTGLIADSISQLCHLQKKLTCVEPSLGMHQEAQQYTGLNCFNQTAEKFAGDINSSKAEKALIKEAIHHIKDPRQLFSNLRENIGVKKILIVTRPPIPGFPLFPAAVEKFRSGQPEQVDIKKDLESEKYRVKIHNLSYPVEMPLSQWESLIRQRFISDLFGFTDSELESGIDVIRCNFRNGEVAFKDQLVFIEADLK